MSMQLKITFTAGGNLGEDFVLDLDKPRLLGRTHKADVVISAADADVSGRHLEFQPDGAGAAVVCLSHHGFVLNGENVGEGVRRPLQRGDELRIGKHVRIRVDSIGTDVGSAGNGAGGQNTSGTRATAGATFATAAARDTMATRAVREDTFATRPATGSAFGGSIVETPISVAGTTAPAPTRVPSSGAAVADDAATVQDATTNGETAPVSFSGADAASVTDAGTGDGETQPMATRVGNMEVIRAIAEEKARAKRFRQRLWTVVAFGALAVLGAVIYWRWPQAERWLAHPKPIAQHFVAAPSGGTWFFVDYPTNARTRTSERANGGIDVETLTGQAHDVPFRLSFDIRRDATELDLSLEESAARESAALGKQGYVFEGAWTDGGFGFFGQRGDYPKSCENGGTQRGVRFYRREFTRSDGTGQWHGILIYFRNVDTAYRLLREIPDPEWPRGEWLLLDDPNLALYAEFLANQWESPGAAALAGYVGRAPTELLKAVDAALKRNLPTEWKETARMIDALILVGLKGNDNVLSEARARLAQLRTAKDIFYDECASNRDCGRAGEAFVRCWGAFGNDAEDLRRRRLLNPDEWEPIE